MGTQARGRVRMTPLKACAVVLLVQFAAAEFVLDDTMSLVQLSAGSGGQPTASNCNGMGTWSSTSGACDCDEGHTGPECANTICPNNCNTQGYCQDGICYCY